MKTLIKKMTRVVTLVILSILITGILSGCSLNFDFIKSDSRLFDNHSEFIKKVKDSLNVPESNGITYSVSEPAISKEHGVETVNVTFVESNQVVASAECMTKNGAMVGSVVTYTPPTGSNYSAPSVSSSATQEKTASEASGNSQTKSKSTGYLSYKNARFGYTVCYPADFNPGSEPENGSGRVFSSDDGKFVIQSWGSYGPLAILQNWTLDGYYDYILSILDYVPTYKHKDAKNNFFVLSGYKGENIIYDKYIIKSDGSESAIRIIYPTERRAEFDDKVTYISHNFKPGSGADSTVAK